MGGAAKSTLWCDLIAAAVDLHVEISSENEACALGAAIIAAKGCGAYAGFKDAVNAMSAKTRVIGPQRELANALSRKYDRYQRMWSCIAGYYDNEQQAPLG